MDNKLFRAIDKRVDTDKLVSRHVRPTGIVLLVVAGILSSVCFFG